MISYRELQEKLTDSSKTRLAILPVGCYEQHGPVLPLDTDNLIAQGAAERLSARLDTEFITHVFPTILYTTTEPNRSFCGTVSVAADPFRDYFRAVCLGILESEFDALLVLNSHGSIIGSLKEICFEIVHQQFRQNIRPVRPALSLNVFDFDREIEQTLGQPVGRHADWKEFLLLYGLLGEEYFHKDRMERLQRFSQNHAFDDIMPKVIGIPAEFRTTDGVQGQPLPVGTDFAELASQVWDITIHNLVESTSTELRRFEQDFARAGAVART